MDNPLLKSRNPDNDVEDIEDLVRDLAYGAMNRDWNAQIYWTARRIWGFDWLGEGTNRSNNQQLFVDKWVKPKGKKPDYALLASLGYLQVLQSQFYAPNVNLESFIIYLLTEKAYELLRKPSTPQYIFISYKRKESSAFALLIEARLRNAGADPKSIFIDKNIPGGALWETRIKEEIERSKWFICLCAPTTFEQGSWVMKEVEWVIQLNPKCTIIPACHNGYMLRDLPKILSPSQGDHIGKPLEQESALDYERLVNSVLNAIGYPTY